MDMINKIYTLFLGIPVEPIDRAINELDEVLNFNPTNLLQVFKEKASSFVFCCFLPTIAHFFEHREVIQQSISLEDTLDSSERYSSEFKDMWVSDFIKCSCDQHTLNFDEQPSSTQEKIVAAVGRNMAAQCEKIMLIAFYAGGSFLNECSNMLIDFCKQKEKHDKLHDETFMAVNKTLEVCSTGFKIFAFLFICTSLLNGSFKNFNQEIWLRLKSEYPQIFLSYSTKTTIKRYDIDINISGLNRAHTRLTVFRQLSSLNIPVRIQKEISSFLGSP